MRVAIYPGSFDPITNGHLDIITRGSKVFDKLIVGVLVNIDKVGLFSIEERVELIKRVTSHLPNVEVVSFNGLLVDLARKYDAKVILKGLRAVTDFEYEFQMALMNNQLDCEIETLFMTTAAANSFLRYTGRSPVCQSWQCIISGLKSISGSIDNTALSKNVNFSISNFVSLVYGVKPE